MAAKKDFTDRFLRSIKPAPAGKRVIFSDAAIPGFGIRVTDKSSAHDIGSFVLVSRFPGSSNPTPRRIGDYPAMSLAEARKIAREWREDIRSGVDPKEKEADRIRQEQQRRADTFGVMFAAFDADHLSELRTGKEVAASVRKHVFPLWEDRPLTSIKKADVNALVRELRVRSPIAANRVLAYIKKAFAWAVQQDLIETSPAAAVTRPSKEVRRDRVLTDLEVRAVWRACEDMGVFGAAFRLMLVTAQRRSEVGGMAWNEVDLEERTWTLLADRTKASRVQVVPLSDLAVRLIEQRPKLGKYVLSSGRSKVAANGAKADTSLSGWSKAKQRLDDLATEQLRELTGDKEATLPEWHVHDLRRTCATNLAKLGVDRIVISKLLNHAEAGITGIYDRHRYGPQVAEALKLWDRSLTAIVGGSAPARVEARKRYGSPVLVTEAAA